MKKKRGFAVITGASSGLGAEFARQLAASGYDLILAARRAERMELLAAEIWKKYPKCLIRIYPVDLSLESEVLQFAEDICREQLAIFVNNAGLGDAGSFTETELEKDLQIIDVNVRCLHILTKLVLRKMEKQGGGYLLNVASSAGLLPAGPYMASYYASKSYVASLTRAVAVELKERRSRVYVGCLCPGPVSTEFNDVANVRFALKGITPQYCVSYALRKMKRRKVVIVPTLTLKFAAWGGKLIPDGITMRITGHQQKKKISAR